MICVGKSGQIVNLLVWDEWNAHPWTGDAKMKKETYEDLIAEISKQLAEKILMEEGDLTARVKTIDGEIAVLLRDVGLRTSMQVLQKTCDEIVMKKNSKA